MNFLNEGKDQECRTHCVDGGGERMVGMQWAWWGCWVADGKGAIRTAQICMFPML
jgi:hypothetical protein